MAFVDPKSLTIAQRTALRRLAAPGLFVRVAKGWRRRGGAERIALECAADLKRLELAREDFSRAAPALMLTYAGRAVAGVIAERNERKRA